MGKLIYEKECACCGEKKPIEDLKAWRYKMPDGKGGTNYYCSYSCYSKVFDSKYKASSVGSRVRIGYKTDKTLR